MTNFPDPNDIHTYSVRHTDDIEEAPDPESVAHPDASSGEVSLSNDIEEPNTTRTYQDDLDTEFTDTDPFTDEATEDPTKELQVPVDEYKAEMDDIALDDLERGHEDMRETIEDRDEDDDNSASAIQ